MKIIENKAEKVLSGLNIKSAPVDVFKIANELGIMVRKAASKKFSGLIFRKNETAFIAISSNESSVRQRFTVAHELGPYIMHPNKETFIEFRDNEENIKRDRNEIQANQFAAALLMPKKMIEKDVKTFEDMEVTENTIKILASKYDVSEQAMTYRLINLNLLNSDL